MHVPLFSPFKYSDCQILREVFFVVGVGGKENETVQTGIDVAEAFTLYNDELLKRGIKRELTQTNFGKALKTAFPENQPLKKRRRSKESRIGKL